MSKCHQISVTNKLQHASIVFVHGLFGHPKNTWIARTPRDTQMRSSLVDQSSDPPRKRLKSGSQELFDEIFWPRDLLPTAIPTARIITWGYDVRIESLVMETSKATVFQHAETLLSDLALIRQPRTAHPIIFVAHSLGGIVVKDALSLSRQETTHLRDILPATIGVAFLGTPHRGSKTASLGKIAFEMSRLLLQNPNIKILRALEEKSEILDRISKSFAQILASKENIKVHSFQEEFETKGMSIVDASSSTIGWDRETRSSLHANHRDMAKYASAGDMNFKRVSSVLQRWVESLSAPRMTSNQMQASYNDSAERPAEISDEDYKRLLARLNFPDARSRMKNVEAAYADTYTWIYNADLGFKAWLQGQDPRPIFWISGKPGSGKSTIMKYALKTEATGHYLREHSQTRWILTSYFFHDRGSEIQKTMGGLLCEILYQMLVQRRDLFPFIYPILQDHHAQEGPPGAASFSVEKLRLALFAIARNTRSPLNCCIFIDALDEHLGNHRDLMIFLKDLACQDWTSNIRLRLCVASRPENIFLDTLHDYPGFAIHEYTRADIRKYAAGRFREEQSTTLDGQQKQITGRLVSQIEAKSDGVFMWVRLVVNELVEGLCEGDTPGELERLLSEIPTELSDLYVRAISRRPRRSTTSVVKHRREAYVMFAMVLRARAGVIKPIPLRHLIGATLFSAGEEQSGAEVDEMSQVSMQRRLNSRSCGLLEITDDQCVQFIHQTAQEFIDSKEGRYIITEDITLANEDPLVLMLGYILERLKSSCEWAIEEFSTYALYSDTLGKPVEAWIQPSMENIPESTLVSMIHANPYMAESLRDANFSTRGKIARRMIVYSTTSLGASLLMCIEKYPEVMDAELSAILLEAALSWPLSIGWDPICFYSLLEADVASHLTVESFSRLDKEFKKSRELNPFRTYGERPEKLWISKTARFRTESSQTDIDEETQTHTDEERQTDIDEESQTNIDEEKAVCEIH